MKLNIRLISFDDFINKINNDVNYLFLQKYNQLDSDISFNTLKTERIPLIYLYIENLNHLFKISHDNKLLYDPLYKVIEFKLKYNNETNKIYYKYIKPTNGLQFMFNEITIKLINEATNHFEWLTFKTFYKNIEKYKFIENSFKDNIKNIILKNKNHYIYNYFPIFISNNILSNIPSYGCYLLKENKTIEDYINIIKFMNKGAYSNTFLVSLKSPLKQYYESKNTFFHSNNKFILKKLNKKLDSNKTRIISYTQSNRELFDIETTSKILHEVRIMELINDPYIAQCYGCLLEYNLKKNKNNIYILLEYGGQHSLKEIIQDRKLHTYIFNIINGLPNLLDSIKKLHNKSIFHRDIKLDNIVYNNTTNSLKLIDFGLSCNFNYGNCNKLAGTKSYFPPNYKKLIKDLNINKRIKLFDYYAFALVCFILINKNLRVLNEINNNIEPTFKKFNKFYRENLNLQTFLNKIVDYLKINPVFENIL